MNFDRPEFRLNCRKQYFEPENELFQNIASIWDFLGRNNTEFENVDGYIKKLHSQIETLYKNQALYNFHSLNMEKIANLY